ncbi:hypothetical protein TWF281_000594 [Arthrobotrys megalospora]
MHEKEYLTEALSVHAITLKVPIHPNWENYVAKEYPNFQILGRVIDGFKFDTAGDCGVEPVADAKYWETLQALIDTISIFHNRFAGAVEFMKVDPEGKELMNDYGVASIEKADTILRSLKGWEKVLTRLVPFFQKRMKVIDKVPGLTNPSENTEAYNIDRMSIYIENGRGDGQGNILYRDDGRQRFSNEFREVINTSEKIIKELDKAIVGSGMYMTGPMFNKLVRDRDPYNDGEYSEPDEDAEEEEKEEEESKGADGVEKEDKEEGRVEESGGEGEGEVVPGIPQQLANRESSFEAPPPYTIQDNFRQIKVWFKCWHTDAFNLLAALDRVGGAPYFPYWTMIKEGDEGVVSVSGQQQARQ